VDHASMRALSTPARRARRSCCPTAKTVSESFWILDCVSNASLVAPARERALDLGLDLLLQGPHGGDGEAGGQGGEARRDGREGVRLGRRCNAPWPPAFAIDVRNKHEQNSREEDQAEDPGLGEILFHKQFVHVSFT
jgi:hypothetical protein